MNIIIYKVATEDCYRCGFEPAFKLTEPKHISREWITRAEYALPADFELAETVCGDPAIYRKDNGEHCALVSDRYFGHGGENPVLIVDGERVKLSKIRDLPW
ncbi:MAG: hypothetical protein J6N18_10685 [Kiritimatiellae bacterium]|nr:hypothetical protein [Kiritimatiellia bacterium]